MPIPCAHTDAYRRAVTDRVSGAIDPQEERSVDFMLTVSIFVIAVLSLDAAAFRWGADTRERPSDRHRN